MPKPVVIIPIHQDNPTEDEVFGISRCGQILSSHTIRFVHPAGLDVSKYLTLIPSSTSIAVPALWMASIRAYNRMILDARFYHLFREFSHILIHEPDSLVLSDQLSYWCTQDFDYIGAPWFDDFSQAIPQSQIRGVGNSGFCLIRVKSIAKILKSKKRWMPNHQIARELLKSMLPARNKYTLREALELWGKKSQVNYAFMISNINCDYFISKYFPNVCANFKIADIYSAVRFAWEVNPEICYELNNKNLPFGIHGWSKYNKQFIMSLL